MDEFLRAVLPALLLALASSVDAFAASFSYGTARIEIPRTSLLAVSAICALTLALSHLLGGLLAPFLPQELTRSLGVLILAILGLCKLFDSSLKRWIRKRCGRSREFRFSALRLHFILQIYADPEEADADDSRILSPKEAAALAAALSLDGLAAGFGSGLAGGGAALILVFAFAATAAAVSLGCRLGRRVACRTEHDLSWVGGALLLVLAAVR